MHLSESNSQHQYTDCNILRSRYVHKIVTEELKTTQFKRLSAMSIGNGNFEIDRKLIGHYMLVLNEEPND